MTTKQEIAAVMASDGDFDKKISLLKKAVVSVTRQKQELEGKLTETLHELSEMSDRATKEAETNAKLRKRIQSLEGELEQERGKGTNFGQNVLKGLSSLMAGNDEGGAAGGGGGGGGASGGRAATPAPALKPEDVERIVRENQQLHMEVYTLKSKRDETKRSRHGERERDLKEISTLQHEVGELRGLLDATTKACDDLNYQCVHRQALAQFCCTFMRPMRAANETLRERTVAVILKAEAAHRREPGAGSPGTPTGSPRSPQTVARQLAPAQQAELIASTLKGYASSLRTLMNGVSVLLLTLRDKLPRSQRATAGDLRSFTTRLSTLVEAHSVQKERILFLASQLDGQVQGMTPSPPPGATESPVEAEAAPARGHIVELQQDILEALMEWLRLLRSHLALVVDSSVAYLPQGQQYALSVLPAELLPGAAATQQPWENVRTRSVVEREVFVDHVTKAGERALGRLEGCVEAVRELFAHVSVGFKQDIDSLGPVWLVAIQQLWLDGVNTLPQLRLETATFSTALGDIAEACNNGALRDALRLIVVNLRACARTTNTSIEEAYVALCALDPSSVDLSSAHMNAANLTNNASRSPNDSWAVADGGLSRARESSATVANNDEVLSALAAADRAAVCYYTQMNATLLELADREDTLRAVETELQRTQVLLEDKSVEAERTRLVLQDQIRLLSDQLVQHTNPQRQPHSSQANRAPTGERGRPGTVTNTHA